MEMQLELELSNIRNYRRLSYTAWHALAEFVDNSTQSYFDNQPALDAQLDLEQEGFCVRIVVDRFSGTIRIWDNAMGMGIEELERAARIGQPPPNTNGRSMYGLGMKTAGCWFSNHIRINSSKLGEPLEHSIELDVERIASGDADLRYRQVPADATSHYTNIDLSDLNRLPKGRTIGRIKDHLRSMYRYDISERLLTLEWDGIPLTWPGPGEMLQAADGTPFHKPFEFVIDGKPVSGWVAILEHGSRAKAGFSILRKRRVIQGWPDAWRPETLYGQRQGSNNLVNQRLVGEIHLDTFEVAHTKDAILWTDEQESEIEEKLLEVAKDYRRRAQERRLRDDIDGPSDAEVAAAATELRAELESPAMVDRLTVFEVPPPEVARAVFEEARRATIEDEPYFEAELSTAGEPIFVCVYLSKVLSSNDPYFTFDVPQERKIQVVINMNHDYVKMLQGTDDLIGHLRHCTYDGLAEWRAGQKQEVLKPESVRSLKDHFMRVPLIRSEEDTPESASSGEG